jgi:hypothetical protein
MVIFIVTAVRTPDVAQNERWSQAPIYLLSVMLDLHALGIPFERGRRALCWKLLLNYLPLARASWSETLTRKRELYKQFIGKFYILLPSYLVCPDTCVCGYCRVLFRVITFLVLDIHLSLPVELVNNLQSVHHCPWHVTAATVHHAITAVVLGVDFMCNPLCG